MDCKCKHILNLQPKCDPVVNVDPKCNPTVNIQESSKGTFYHDKLVHRDLPDQHPIDAITGLQDILRNIWTHTFEQEIPETTWVVTHNLGRAPSWVVVDTAGNVQIPDEVAYDSDNQITFKFISAFAGRVYLN